MARVLPGTAPQVVAHGQADMRPAFAWIEAHSDAFRGQWVAVRLVDPVLVASAPTLSQLWQMISPALLKDCVLHYIGTVENANQVQIREPAGSCAPAGTRVSGLFRSVSRHH